MVDGGARGVRKHQLQALGRPPRCAHAFRSHSDIPVGGAHNGHYTRCQKRLCENPDAFFSLVIADCYLAADHFYFLRTDEEEEVYIDARHALLEFRKLIPRALHEETLGTHLCLLFPQTVKSTTR